MRLKKKNIIKIIESYILEKDEDQKEETSALVSLENFVIEKNSAKLFLNYEKKNIDVTIKKTNVELKALTGKEAAAYLNVALIYVYEEEDIRNLVRMCKSLDILKKDKEEENIVNYFIKQTKPMGRSRMINNIFKQNMFNQSKAIAQNIINNNLN